MNTYRVTATRSNGTEVSDNFTEPTESAARKSFKECYRHDIYTNINVELIAENALASKQQELEVLEKIKKLVETLGLDSYLATAFRGVFDIAEQNIENDFADNPIEARDLAWKELAEMKKALVEAEPKYSRLEATVNRLTDELDNARRWAEEQEERLKNATEAREDAQIAAQEAESDRRAAEQQIIELKAKLFDYMTTGK